jgi:hypothetical protein
LVGDDAVVALAVLHRRPVQAGDAALEVFASGLNGWWVISPRTTFAIGRTDHLLLASDWHTS